MAIMPTSYSSINNIPINAAIPSATTNYATGNPQPMRGQNGGVLPPNPSWLQYKVPMDYSQFRIHPGMMAQRAWFTQNPAPGSLLGMWGGGHRPPMFNAPSPMTQIGMGINQNPQASYLSSLSNPYLTVMKSPGIMG